MSDRIPPEAKAAAKIAELLHREPDPVLTPELVSGIRYGFTGATGEADHTIVDLCDSHEALRKQLRAWEDTELAAVVHDRDLICEQLREKEKEAKRFHGTSRRYLAELREALRTVRSDLRRPLAQIAERDDE
jgi:hypothetical protein